MDCAGSRHGPLAPRPQGAPASTSRSGDARAGWSWWGVIVCTVAHGSGALLIGRARSRPRPMLAHLAGPLSSCPVAPLRSRWRASCPLARACARGCRAVVGRLACGVVLRMAGHETARFFRRAHSPCAAGERRAIVGGCGGGEPSVGRDDQLDHLRDQCQERDQHAPVDPGGLSADQLSLNFCHSRQQIINRCRTGPWRRMRQRWHVRSRQREARCPGVYPTAKPESFANRCIVASVTPFPPGGSGTVSDRVSPAFVWTRARRACRAS